MSYSERLHIIVDSGNEGAPTSLYREGKDPAPAVGFRVLRLSETPPRR